MCNDNKYPEDGATCPPKSTGTEEWPSPALSHHTEALLKRTNSLCLLRVRVCVWHGPKGTDTYAPLSWHHKHLLWHQVLKHFEISFPTKKFKKILWNHNEMTAIQTWRIPCQTVHVRCKPETEPLFYWSDVTVCSESLKGSFYVLESCLKRTPWKCPSNTASTANLRESPAQARILLKAR